MRTLSAIIPSHNDIYLHKTIASILDNSRGEIEVIVVLDGHPPRTPITSDPRVKVIKHPRNMGMREAINTGVAAATGTHLMRSDEHCAFAPGFDTTILDTIEDNWIVTPRRYKLDPVKWEVMWRRGYIDYEKLVILNRGPLIHKFSANEWKDRTLERADIPIDENMAIQGSVWFMPHTWWDKVIGRLQTEGYGPLYQDSTEMVFKTWRAGGKLMINKLTWFAHKHRNFNRTHHYPIARAIPEWQYALDVWADDYEKVRQQWGL